MDLNDRDPLVDNLLYHRVAKRQGAGVALTRAVRPEVVVEMQEAPYPMGEGWEEAVYLLASGEKIAEVSRVTGVAIEDLEEWIDVEGPVQAKMRRIDAVRDYEDYIESREKLRETMRGDNPGRALLAIRQIQDVRDKGWKKKRGAPEGGDDLDRALAVILGIQQRVVGDKE